MAKHQVGISIPEKALGNAPVEFKVKKDDAVLGTLKVRKGSVVWVQKDAIFGYKMGWTDFDAMMREKGVREKS